MFLTFLKRVYYWLYPHARWGHDAATHLDAVDLHRTPVR
jgi:hypothetical protein